MCHGRVCCLNVIVVHTLHCRKNKLRGSVLRRGCWCSKTIGKVFCPIHFLAPLLDKVPNGSLLFEGIAPSMALAYLRSVLVDLSVPKAMEYRTHDLRRGHARDLQCNGASLYEILSAGEWRSPAFMQYLDVNTLERDVVVEAHVDESSGGEA